MVWDSFVIKWDNCADKFDIMFAAKFILKCGDPLALFCCSINWGKDFTESALNRRVV